MPVRFGYACINMELSEKGIICSRTMRKATFQKKGIAYAAELALSNAKNILPILKWNNDNNIKVFRISSTLMPWASEYEFEDMPNYEEFCSVLGKIGKYARMTGQKISFHPGQFNCLASEKEHVILNCIKDLEIHGRLFDLMHMPKSPQSKINIHLGSTCGNNRQLAFDNFCRNFDRLSESVKTRLTVENDDKESMFSSKMLYEGIYKQIGVPIVFDAHHHTLGPQDASYEEALAMAVETWPEGVRPTCHHSNSRKKYEDPTVSRHAAHSDYYYEPFTDHGHEVDVVLEAKQKERALFDYLKKWPQEDLK